jgi:hypothetical protein
VTVYVGSPSHRNSAGFTLAFPLLAGVIGAIVALLVWGLYFLARGAQLFVLANLVRSFAVLLPFAGALIFGLAALWRRRGNAARERAVDRELDALPPGYVAFCGRPWTGETAARPKPKRGDGVEEWRLTDSQGRPIGSVSPDRVVVGPTGTWLIGVGDRIPSAELPGRRAAVRDQAISLGRFLRNGPLCTDLAAGAFEVRALLADVGTGELHDISGGATGRLGALSQVIGAAPSRSSGTERRGIVAALALCYSEAERETALKAIEVPGAA